MSDHGPLLIEISLVHVMSDGSEMSQARLGRPLCPEQRTRAACLTLS